MIAMEVHTLLSSENGLPILNAGEASVLPIPYEAYTLRIVIPGTSTVMDSATSLECNVPLEGKEFDRKSFSEYPFDSTHLTQNVVTDIVIRHGGAFTVKIGDSVAWDFMVAQGFSLKGQRLNANSLCIQTVLSKLVDPKSSVRSKQWRKTLEYIASKNYNMIHFVPLQARGESDSPFSISDQLKWDPVIFPQGDKDIEYLVQQLEDIGISGLSDIVLNHTASDSAWIGDHLDAGYSPENSPHSQAAVDLDNELLKAAHGDKIETIEDVDRIVGPAVQTAAQVIKLWEYYVVDVASTTKEAENWTEDLPEIDHIPHNLTDIAKALRGSGHNMNVLGKRFSRRIDIATLIQYASQTEYSLRQILDEVNVPLYTEYNDDLVAAINSVKDRQTYLRLSKDGPKIGNVVTVEAPLIESYFNRRFGLPLACNGWVWGGNPSVDHAGPESKAYIRRELIVWGDCIKLRYGKGPGDSPYLWKRMGDYARSLAKYFNGLRIDNAHSTPLHVGEYILDEARKVRPNLYVVAELFSGSQEMDKLYVERLAINSLLREAIMPADPQDLSTVIHQNGGLPIGCFINPVLAGSKPHAWLVEVSHDNEAMAEKRTVEDTLSTAGLVAMCQAASGSVFGCDEVYGESLNVVTEARPYILGGGIKEAKTVSNRSHQELGSKEMCESYTDYQGQYITVHRINPETGDGVFLVARTKFWPEKEQELNTITSEASNAEWGHGWSLIRKEQDTSCDGIYQVSTELRTIESIEASNDANSSEIRIDPIQFPQGSVAFWYTSRTFDATKVGKLVRESADDIVKDLDYIDLNVLLYHADGEERAATNGKRGVYTIPDFGPLTYAGSQGWEILLRRIVSEQDLGHPLCQNLRSGLWASEYLVDRVPEDLSQIKQWLSVRLEVIRGVPSFLRPRYFAAVVSNLFKSCIKHTIQRMGLQSESISMFYRQLVMTSVQMAAKLPNASSFPYKKTLTMAAGLPHFSEGIMRCWGRDVFLSVTGSLLRLNRFEEAKEHILGFGATLKYGLIPNLLDSGSEPRYNARDASWFFVQCIQDYCKLSNSLDLLQETTRRRFPLDDEYTEEPTDVYSKVGDLVFEISQRHAAGIKFREHNAGPQIDRNMKSNGFNQHIWTDWETGFVHGGNQDNCGTWQDKMGESPLAGSVGTPGTPRDGAAIEITGLLKSCLRWVNQVRASGGYSWPETVKKSDGDDISLVDWEKSIQCNFERCYYVPESQDVLTTDGKHYDVDWSIVNRRGIYKDLYRSGKEFEDYQFRPNFTMAVIAAPESFDTDKIMTTLSLADEVLRGPVGMATLDPSDWNYRPYYVNGLETTDFATSRGLNYHQGPEWVWLYGTFLQAYIQTLQRRKVSRDQILKEMRYRVQGHVKWIIDSPWAGLTEVTQKNGEFCPDSSPTQAWSSARLIDAIHSLTT